MITTHYDDAEVPLLAPLLNMAINQNWVYKYTNITRPSLVNTIDRIYPFIVLDLAEDQVSSFNEDDESLTRASYVTLQYIKKLKKLMTREIPDTADGFMLLIKWYAKLNLALFSETRTLFQALVKVIDSIKYFSQVARDAMTLNIKASIIWIILIQIRKFSMGYTTILAEFSTMHTNLFYKQCFIIHAEVTIELLVTTHRKCTRYFDPVTDQITKKQNRGNPQGTYNLNT